MCYKIEYTDLNKITCKNYSNNRYNSKNTNISNKTKIEDETNNENNMQVSMRKLKSKEKIPNNSINSRLVIGLG